ncbi:MAG: hypothetical protein WDZ59_02480 [Pirellulales bacterium]
MSHVPLEHDFVKQWRPQFGLRRLMLAVTLMAVLLTVMSWLGPTGSAALAILLLLGMAHAGGNALGKHLRDTSSAVSRSHTGAGFGRPYGGHGATPCEIKPPAPGSTEPRLERITALPRAKCSLASSHLQNRSSLGWRVPLCMITFALCFGIAGGVLLVLSRGVQLSTPGLVLGAISAAVVGSFAGFLVAAFWLAARSAWREASHSS